jgi:hypothetical protein
VVTVPEAGWAGRGNGDLLRRASREFDAFVTVDRGQVHQQNVRDLPLRILVLRARSNRLESLLPLVPRNLWALPTARPGAFTILEIPTPD